MIDKSKLGTAPEWLANMSPDDCLLCNAPKAVIGVFIPGKSNPMGHPNGGSRLLIYGLCGECSKRADELTLLIEQVIELRMKRAGAARRGDAAKDDTSQDRVGTWKK